MKITIHYGHGGDNFIKDYPNNPKRPEKDWTVLKVLWNLLRTDAKVFVGAKRIDFEFE